ncbi:unnamed protein product [Closterium sp. Naga37s-1]|nr:unnamed protein product [Closterium sp. Naga37s-1]
MSRVRNEMQPPPHFPMLPSRCRDNRANMNGIEEAGQRLVELRERKQQIHDDTILLAAQDLIPWMQRNPPLRPIKIGPRASAVHSQHSALLKILAGLQVVQATAPSLHEAATDTAGTATPQVKEWWGAVAAATASTEDSIRSLRAEISALTQALVQPHLRGGALGYGGACWGAVGCAAVVRSGAVGCVAVQCGGVRCDVVGCGVVQYGALGCMGCGGCGGLRLGAVWVEAATGLVFRFIVGHGSAEDEQMLQAENSTHGDFFRVDVQESYLNLNHKM